MKIDTALFNEVMRLEEDLIVIKNGSIHFDHIEGSRFYEKINMDTFVKKCKKWLVKGKYRLDISIFKGRVICSVGNYDELIEAKSEKKAIIKLCKRIIEDKK